jgi:hypothetical protein
MSYASDAAAVGQAADAEVSSLKSSNASLSTANDQLSAQNAELQRQLELATKPPTPGPVKTAWGSSGLDSGPSSYAAIATLLHPALMRSYNSGAVADWKSSNGAKVPAHIPAFDSAKWDQTKVAAGDPATMASIRDWLLNGDGQRCWHHEPEGDFALSVYNAAYAQIVKLGVGLDRLFPTLMAFTLGVKGAWTKWGDPDQYYVKEAGGLGFDAYSYANNSMVQFDEAAAYAAKKAKPWILAEAGFQTLDAWTKAGSKAVSDDTLIAWADTLVARVRSYPNPPLAVSLMNHGPQLVDGTTHQKFAAHWKDICTGAI